MKKILNPNKPISRRELLKFAAYGAAALTLPSLVSCSSVRAREFKSITKNHPLAIKNCRIIDVKSGKILKEDGVLIENRKISALVSAARINAGIQTIDAGGKFLIPGLIDSHCHTTMTPVFGFSIFDAVKHYEQQARHFSISIETGVTTLRDVGSFPLSLRGFIEDIESGDLSGPRVFYSNAIQNIKGGHPEIPHSEISIFAAPASAVMGNITSDFKSKKELADSLKKNAEGASLIKITMDNKSVFCRNGDIMTYSDTDLSDIFSFAEKSNLPVSGHCQYAFGFQRAIQYPINSVEHITSDKILSDSDIETMVKKNIAIVPTMMVGQSYMMIEAFDDIPDEFKSDFIENELSIRNRYFQHEAFTHCNPEFHRENLEALKMYKKYGIKNLWKNKKYLVNPNLFFGMMKYGIENLKRMRSAGALIGCAMDAGMPFCYFGALKREIEFYSRAGFKNDEILRCVTINNAKILKADDIIGSIEIGKLADLVLLDSNPLTDIKAYGKVSLVIKDGYPVHAAKNFEQALAVQ